MSRAERRRTTPARAQTAQESNRRRILIYATLAVLAIGLIVGVALMSRVQSVSDTPAATLHVGDTAPNFSVSTTAGPFDLANAGGKPTLLEVFATWCPHCQHEAKIISAVYNDYKSRVNVVGVEGSRTGMDRQTPSSEADMMAWAQQYGATYPIAFDPDKTVEGLYLQEGYPAIFLIDKDRKIVAMGEGELADTSLRAALDDELAGKPVNPAFATPKKS